MKIKNLALVFPVLTAALLSGCGVTTVGTAAVPLTAQGKALTTSTTAAQPAKDMLMAEVSGRIGAWARGRIGAWAKGQELDASTLLDGTRNTFSENLPAWRSIHLAEAQQLAPHLGQGITVAVIDTGITPTHPVFQGHLAPSSSWYDFNDGDTDPTEVPTAGNGAYGHGTGVADVVLQVAPKAIILPIRALDSDGTGSSANLAKAVSWAASHGAKIINISAVSNVDNALTAALSAAASQGIYVTLAAGNESDKHVPYPASNSVGSTVLAQYALNAGATNSDTTLADWSDYGKALEISAPGVDVTTAVPTGYARASGTSFSAPVLAGVLALALGENLKPTFKGKLADQINATGTNIDTVNAAIAKQGKYLGAGLLNAQAFLKSLQ